MANLITLNSGKPFVSTIDIADGIGVTNPALIKTIRMHQSEFEDVGEVRFQIGAQDPNNSKARAKTYALLNESQAIFLLTLSKNTKVVVKFKLQLTKEFGRLRHQAERRAQLDWQQVRAQGKIARRQETDVIQEFVKYAKDQGSKHAETYYINLTKASYKALFLVNGPTTGLREKLDPVQLSILATTEYVANQALQDGMNQRLPYKECFVLARDRMKSLGDIAGTTPLLPEAA